MHTKRVLFSWIGITDLRAMAGELPPDRQAAVLKGLTPPAPLRAQAGPLKTLLDRERFDEVHLLSDHGRLKDQAYLEWIGGLAVIHHVKLASPIDYSEIFLAADAELASVVNRPRHERLELCMHLSPGTPQMAAIWVLLGKSKYHPTTFYQTHEGEAFVTSIPFDLVVDFVPQVLRDADANLQRLASQSPQDLQGFQSVVGNSRDIRLAVGRASRSARRDVSVLILGESGTGKELFAKAIHDASTRRAKPFVAINCAAIARELLESDRAGAFTAADSGTLFLDEVGECDPAMQSTLLRVLQPPDHNPSDRVFHRVGDSKPLTSNVRIIAATNQDLLDAIADHKFRADLYYRLAVITIKLPPLRDRRDDIPVIVNSLIGRINKNFETQEPGFQHKLISDSAIEFVKKHPWPGNVRQLYNTLMQAAVMTDDPVIDRRDVADALAEVPGKTTANLLDAPLGDGFSLEEHLEKIQRHYLRRAMEASGGVKKRAADLLGYRNYQTLAAQLDRLDLKN
jgi:DNA-binding NtrC family response regulator